MTIEAISASTASGSRYSETKPRRKLITTNRCRGHTCRRHTRRRGRRRSFSLSRVWPGIRTAVFSNASWTRAGTVGLPAFMHAWASNTRHPPTWGVAAEVPPKLL